MSTRPLHQTDEANNTVLAGPQAPDPNQAHGTPLTAIPRIDLCDPRCAASMLEVDLEDLLAMVNIGQIPAFRIGEAIRFRTTDLANVIKFDSALDD